MADETHVTVKVPKWLLAALAGSGGLFITGGLWLINLEYRVRDNVKASVAAAEREKAFNDLKTEIAVLNSNVTNLTNNLGGGSRASGNGDNQ